MDERGDLLTLAEAARELGISARAMQERVKRGLMRGIRVTPRMWLVSREEVERVRAIGRFKSGPKPKRDVEGMGENGR